MTLYTKWMPVRLMRPLHPIRFLLLSLALSPLNLQSAALAAPSRSAQVSQVSKVRASKAIAAPRPGREYVLGPQDVLDIRVGNHEMLNRTVTVRPDGRISFPRVGEVQAGGRTVADLTRQLRTRLERTLNNVRLEIEVKQARPVPVPPVRQARVIGAVKSPGAFPVKPNSRVVDLLAMAGGLGAKPSRVAGRIVRRGQVLPVDLARAMAQPGGEANLAVQPDDLLILDESSVPNQVTVTGKIAKPGSYPLDDGLTLTSLLAQAGGPVGGAALKQAHVLRNGVPIPLDLSDSSPEGAAAASAFRFQMGDVLVLPENQARYGLLGQVVRPAYYPLPETASESTVLKLMALAGGATADADLRNATITRLAGGPDGQNTVTPVNVDAMLKGEAPDNVVLRADDVLFVPKRTAQVHVIGPVGRPGAFEIKDNMNLLSLISETGSPSNSAGLSKAYVLRAGTQIPLDLYSVLVEGKTDSAVSKFELRSGDVLVIPDISDQVHVIGQVAKPGPYRLDERLTLASLIAQVGNPAPGAALSKAYVLRDDKRIPLDLHRFLVAGQSDATTEGFKFRGGDVLVVPENSVRYAVMGQVARAGYYSFPERESEATVLKALAQAGGPLQGGEGGANLAGAGIIRTVNGRATVIPINIAELLQKGALANNIALQPEDVLYIPPKRRGFRWTDVLSPLSLLTGVVR